MNESHYIKQIVETVFVLRNLPTPFLVLIDKNYIYI